MRSTYSLGFALALTVTIGAVLDRGAVAQTPTPEPAPPPASAGDGAPADSVQTSAWPGFRGQDREGVYRGPFRLSWEGLAPMWKKPIGGGRSSFAVADGRAFTIEQRQRNEVVAASRHRSSPLAPSANTEPSAHAGVARGPSPPPIH